MRFDRTLALIAMQLVLLFATLEILGRVLDPLGISYYPESARFFDRLIRDEPLGYRLPPSMTDEFWGVEIRTNSIGMRDREVTIPKPATERRVMVLGDSGAFSLGVEYEDSIPAQLEDVLNEQASEGVRYRTLNMGVPSYNTEQQLSQLETLGLSLQPDLVVLYFSTNDIEPRMWVFEKRKNPLVNLAQRSYAASIGFILLRRAAALANGHGPELIQYSSFAPGNPRWLAIEASLSAIARHLSNRSIPFLVVTAGEEGDAHMVLLRRLGEASGFPVGRLDAVSKGSKWAANPEPFVNSPIDHHCNPRGCRLIAEDFARLMAAAGMMPDANAVDAAAGTKADSAGPLER